MSKIIFLLLLVAFLTPQAAVSQSGRRITTPAPTAPIQPSIYPEPEPRPVITTSALLFLPERVREKKITGLDGGSFRFADFAGKVIVINIWASWCGPCRREVPEYEKVRKDYAEREVEFIGLTTENPNTSSGRVKQFLRDVNFGFRLGWADRETAQTLMNGRTAIPQTLVIDGSGRVVSHWTGYARGRSGERLKHTIEEALQKTQSLPVPPGD